VLPHEAEERELQMLRPPQMPADCYYSCMRYGYSNYPYFSPSPQGNPLRVLPNAIGPVICKPPEKLPENNELINEKNLKQIQETPKSAQYPLGFWQMPGKEQFMLAQSNYHYLPSDMLQLPIPNYMNINRSNLPKQEPAVNLKVTIPFGMHPAMPLPSETKEIFKVEIDTNFYSKLYSDIK
jgi:hypothetical protein